MESFLTCDSDPTVNPGVFSPGTSLLLRTDTPGVYLKTGDSNTSWTLIGTNSQVARRTARALTRQTFSGASDTTAGQNNFDATADADNRAFNTQLSNVVTGVNTTTRGLTFAGVGGNGNRDFPILILPDDSWAGITGLLPEWADASNVYSSGDNTVAILTLRQFTLVHNGSSSSAANRLSLPNNQNVVLEPGDGALLAYNVVTSRWNLVGE